MKKIGFIINPIAGTKPKDCVPEFISKYLENAENSVTIKFTVRPGHATELAAEMVQNGFDVVAAVGGDGTVNEVAKALIHTQTAFTIIPFGSGNGLARHLGIPLKTEEAIKFLAKYRIAEIDYATANGIPFFCTCGVGFDAHIGHQFSIAEKRGFFTYVKSTIREFIKYKPKKYRLSIGKEKIKSRAFLVTFANASQYGNDAHIAPEADIQDGKLDVCIFKPFPAYKVLRLAISLFRKNIHQTGYVEIFRAPEIILKRKRKAVFHYDGEPLILKKKIKVNSIHKGLRVAVPASSKLQLL